MLSLPKISIITPTFNSAKDIEHCIMSVANQTYKNIEHIFIDGASEDNTVSLIKAYSAKYSHIKFISEPDQGIYDAMNKSIDMATGEWLYFLGSDDELYDKYVLEDIFGKTAQTQADVIYGDVLYKHSNFRYKGEFDLIKLYYANICHQAIFTRNTVFDKIGRFNINYKVSADYDFNIRWFFKFTIRRKYIDKVIAVFNENGYSSFGNNESFSKEKAYLFRKHLSTSDIAFPIKVSVIIPNHNTQELPRLIKNVLNQSFPFFELLFLNKDNDYESKEIIDWYAQQDNRIKIQALSQEQTWEDGINNAVAEAKGQWLWIVTPETYADQRFLEILLPHAEGNAGAGLVMSSCYLYHYNALVGNFPADAINEGSNKWLNNTIINSEEAIKYTFIHYNPIVSIGTVLIERDSYKQAGGVEQYSSNYWDWLLYIKILLNAKLIYIAAELSFVVYPQKTVDKKIGKAIEIMSLAEYTKFTSALLAIFRSNNYITSLLLKSYTNFWHDKARKDSIKMGHLRLFSQMLQQVNGRVKVSLYKKMLLNSSNFTSISRSIFKQLGQKRIQALSSGENPGQALKQISKQHIHPYLIKFPEEVAKERPRILHVIANFFTGGSSRLVLDLIENLSTAYEQEVVVPSLPNPPAYIGHVIRALGSYQVQEIDKYIADFNPQMMHVHYWGKGDYKWYELFFRMAEKYRIPVIENVNVPIQPYYSTAVKEYVYVSQFVVDQYSTPGTQGTVVYPGSDFSFFTNSADLSTNNCIGMVYRLDEDKLNENSIDVFIKVAQRQKEVTCLIVGGGTFYNLYREKVRKAGVESNFEFTGYVEYHQLPALYQRMGIFVAPVWDESFGQVSPFAMHMGLPIVGYNVGALPEIICNLSLLAPPGDSDHLADIIINLLGDYKRRTSLASFNISKAKEEFSVDAMIENYLRLYKNILRNSSTYIENKVLPEKQ